MLGIRDEFLDRPWRPPARHWPGSLVVGGLDEQGGGTWLAVYPAERRISCVLNARGEPAPQPLRRSRGELPLRPGVEDLTPYDPFHLLYADVAVARLLSWDGVSAVTSDLGPGTHVLTNAGRTTGELTTGGRDEDPKAAYFGPRFAAARDWDAWQALAEGDGLAVDDQRAIIVRRELPDGRVWGTSSVSMVALAADGGIRYEFRSVDGDWKPVEFLCGLHPRRRPGLHGADQLVKHRREVAQFGQMRGGEVTELVLAEFGEHDPDDPAVLVIARPADEPGVFGPVDEFHRAVVAQQQVPGQLADGRRRSVSLDRDEQLVLRGRQARVARPRLAPAQEFAQAGTEGQQVLIVVL